MLFSKAEIEALLLLRWCSLISVRDMQAAFTNESLLALRWFRFIAIYKKHDAFILTREGSRFLDEHFEGLPSYVKPTYRESYILRRLHVARLLLTAYRGGMSVFTTDTDALEQCGSFYLTFISRAKGINPWGSTRVAALVRLGNKICGAHYVESGIGKISLTDEMNALNNSTARFKDITRGLIYTGESYDAILSALDETEEQSQSRLVSYGAAFQRLQMPVFLIPSDEVGAQQLRIMAQPNYRARMTRLALGPTGLPAPADHPEWDAVYQGMPFVMAADMDLRRIDAAAKEAVASGKGPIYLVGLKGQEEILRTRYKATGLAQKVFTFSREKPEVRNAFALYSPAEQQFESAKGEVIRVPPLSKPWKDKKAARQ